MKYKPDIHIRLYYLLNFLSKLQTDEGHHTPVLTSWEIDIDYKSREVFRNFNMVAWERDGNHSAAKSDVSQCQLT